MDIAVLFADVRGSTTLGERSTPTDFAALMNRFYEVATTALIRHEAVIDRLIGDEVMAFFVRGISGPGYRRQAVDAGVAVNAGIAYVGNVGETVTDFTALGDTGCKRRASHPRRARHGE